MDEGMEQHCVGVLAEALKVGRTLLLVTHRPALLALVERIIVIDQNSGGLLLDGPRDQVLAHLARGRVQPGANPQPTASVTPAVAAGSAPAGTPPAGTPPASAPAAGPVPA
jgi:ATP-binding cassette, subfamily C, bacterial LapB